MPVAGPRYVPFERTDGTNDVAKVGVVVLDGRPHLQGVDFGYGAGLTPTEMDVIAWGRMLDLAVATREAKQRARRKAPGARGYVFEITADDEAAAHRTRRTLGDDLYQQVARHYLEGGGGVEAVAEAFTVSRRQATRYVATARERGFLA